MANLSIAALRDPNALKLVASQLVSQVCDKLLLVAVMWLLADAYGAAWVPWYAAAGGLPHLVLAWYAGRFIARYGGLKVVVAADFYRGALYLVFPLLFPGDTPHVAALLGLALLANIGAGLFNPAILTLPVEIVTEERRGQVNAMIDACFSLANVVGPVLSVLLYAKLGLRGLMLVNGASYLYAGFLQLGIRTPAPSSAGVASSGAPVSPLAVLRREKLVRQVLLTFLGINLFGAPFFSYLPLYVKQVYGGELGGLATLEAALGAGAIVGALTLALLKSEGRLGRRIVVGVAGVAAAFAVFAASRSLWVGVGSVFFMGAAMALSNIWILTFFQSKVPPADVGSLMGAVNFITVAALPVSMGITGLVVGRVAVTTLAAVSAVGVVAIAATLATMPKLREV